MNHDISQLVAQIRRLRAELDERFSEARREFRYSLQGRKVRFSNEMRELHQRYRVDLLPYLRDVKLWNVITAPVIYAMFIPLLFMDISITLYQHICFRAYGIPRVRRRDYLVFDRHLLGYLNAIEKFNCVYCSYGNGLIAYAREIIGRTEQHWCPIRHAQRILDAHERYPRFFAYGDAKSYAEKLEELRAQLEQTNENHLPH